MDDTEQTALTLRLAAVAFADVAHYSRLMSEDSDRTVRHWARLRHNILLPEMRNCGGTVVSEAGDAVLLEFPSVTAAVRWAIDVQNAARLRPTDEQDMQIRIGINVDDVIDDGENLQSDGIVIASRIHQFAAPGTIVVTEIARDIARNRLPLVFRDKGTPSLKNIDRLVRIFEVEEVARTSELIQPHSSWTSCPTLAVLPFETIGGPDESRYFGEGITEDIITGISRSRSMFVIARNSTIPFAEGGQSQKDIAAALGVKYLLIGSVRRQGPALRINTELVDVAQSRTIWAERFDGLDNDIFSFQDQIVSSIVATLEPKVLRAEAAKLGGRPTDSLDAYDCVLRALSELYRANPNGYARARDLLTRAVSLDRGYGSAHAYLAWTINFQLAEKSSTNPEADIKAAIAQSRMAVEIDPEDAMSLAVRGHIMGLHEQQPMRAVEMMNEALILNPNLPLAWGLSATNLAYAGNVAEARSRLMNVWKLTPYDPLNFFYHAAGGLVEFVAGEYEEAIRYLERARQAKPQFVAALRILAAAQAMVGLDKEARETGQELLKADPSFSIHGFVSWYPLQSGKARENLAMGLSVADLPSFGESNNGETSPTRS